MKIRTIRTLALAAVLFAGACASADKDGGPALTRQRVAVQQASLMKALSFQIKSPVRAGQPYPAVMLCSMPAAGVDNVMGYFFWNQEGPFEYSLDKFEEVNDRRHGRCAKLKFMLYTGRPSTYTISGYVTYRDTATGAIGTTNTVSAGAVTVR